MAAAYRKGRVVLAIEVESEGKRLRSHEYEYEEQDYETTMLRYDYFGVLWHLRTAFHGRIAHGIKQIQDNNREGEMFDGKKRDRRGDASCTEKCQASFWRG